MSAALRVGELFAGYGGLGMGLAMVTGTRTAWVADIEPGPRAYGTASCAGSISHGGRDRSECEADCPVLG